MINCQIYVKNTIHPNQCLTNYQEEEFTFYPQMMNINILKLRLRIDKHKKMLLEILLTV